MKVVPRSHSEMPQIAHDSSVAALSLLPYRQVVSIGTPWKLLGLRVIRPNEKNTMARILIADDHQDTAETMSAFFAAHGYEARTAYDGFSALEAIFSFDPEIVFLDLSMPRMTGYQVAVALREQNKRKADTSHRGLRRNGNRFGGACATGRLPPPFPKTSTPRNATRPCGHRRPMETRHTGRPETSNRAAPVDLCSTSDRPVLSKAVRCNRVSKASSLIEIDGAKLPLCI